MKDIRIWKGRQKFDEQVAETVPQFLRSRADNAEADEEEFTRVEEADLPNPPPPPLQPVLVTATEGLRRNLERSEETFRNRERVLLEEIQTRQTELADVRRAADAVMAGLLGLMELEVGDLTDGE